MTQLDLTALYRLSRAASDSGHYNLSKLLHVAAVSYVNRTAWTAEPLTSDRALAEAVAALEPQLRAAQLDQPLLAALTHARETVAAGQLISYEEAPIIYVCRVCGAVVPAPLPEYCAYCGAGQLVFQLIPATFYLESAPVPVLMAQLARTPNWLESIFSGLTEDQATRRIDGNEGEWSLHEAAGHLLDTQELIAQRVQLFLEHEAPNLNAKAMWQAVESARWSATDILSKFRLSREAMLTQLRSAPADCWGRSGQHAEFGPVTLQQQCTYFAKHEHWHMAQMTRIRQTL
jgi:uncharacterized damage-inducible protein DinB